MNAPIAELAVAVIEILTPAAGMNAVVEWPKGRRTAPHIPIERVRGRSVWLGVFFSTAAVQKQANHSDLTDRARFEKFHSADVVRPNAPMKIDLDNAPAFSRSVQHGAAFFNGMACRFLDEYMSASL